MLYDEQEPFVQGYIEAVLFYASPSPKAVNWTFHPAAFDDMPDADARRLVHAATSFFDDNALWLLLAEERVALAGGRESAPYEAMRQVGRVVRWLMLYARPDTHVSQLFNDPYTTEVRNLLARLRDATSAANTRVYVYFVCELQEKRKHHTDGSCPACKAGRGTYRVTGSGD